MTRSTLLPLAAALLLSCDAAAAPQPEHAAQSPPGAAAPAAADPEAPPQVENARFERAMAQGGVAATLRRLGAGDRDAFWVAWYVPIVADHPYTCCWTSDWKPGPCRLEARNQSWGNSDRERERAAGPNLAVLVRMADGAIGRVRAVSQGCGLDLGGRRLVWLDGVDPEDSLRALTGLAREGGGGRKGDDPAEEAVMAISLHGLAQADAALEALATGEHRTSVREAALFWLGQTRGRRGYEVLSRVVRRDPDGEIREKAVFALSQSEVPEAADTIVEVARGDRSAEVRGQALFWLAQGQEQRPQVILEAVSRDPDPEVREEAVFALSQLEDEGVELLVRVVRESRDPEIRRKALFWLGQSEDPRALEFLSDLLGE
ncbi:MAG TPA: HEAT repeat domain-containing protein [Thermoanaerobaculia bacterium]|nr:HEAT repeat domain-containing protein [Thermoanaerobaculia bacterium]